MTNNDTQAGSTPANLLNQIDHPLAVHLLQTEKMAGIGQLAAGVAHEINNPVGYVFSNLKTLAGYMQDMLKIIDATDHVDSMSELHQLKKALDYDYIRQDVPALLRESEEGMDRIKHIISALKYFSHTDDDSFRLADLHQSIESTLTVAGNEIKYRAQVIKQFGVLPHVQFNVSQINQVVMNLLINAAQSIENSGMITLRTDQDGAWVWFEVEDTGCGMTPEVQQRIFEPFYTTKPVGQGTGMGLALSYGIVQKHNGRIDVFSRVGHGTRIRVWLPVHQPNV
ncbi:ATP-binding protein [Neopusillimonas maritima]|jgi:signal transduction histidine kinase|uniref:histidine kinase n=1 Tax=Neopusillimonas maritima TaxID=2026239 RepID=A0A3A1YU25_9BURK|nr:ATP-binding protein [Neopusillimonas maritima]MBF24675.1 ATPase [Pusillimonas sp.]RIY41712.1 hypothetical protein CJP73_04495 [Neopusillimonas maritima]|tara:strand:+ start:153308 stop:154153 length:846 start_codon:yes stop_codon:yes gene_type:complete